MEIVYNNEHVREPKLYRIIDLFIIIWHSKADNKHGAWKRNPAVASTKDFKFARMLLSIRVAN